MVISASRSDIGGAQEQQQLLPVCWLWQAEHREGCSALPISPIEIPNRSEVRLIGNRVERIFRDWAQGFFQTFKDTSDFSSGCTWLNTVTQCGPVSLHGCASDPLDIAACLLQCCHIWVSVMLQVGQSGWTLIESIAGRSRLAWVLNMDDARWLWRSLSPERMRGDTVSADRCHSCCHIHWFPECQAMH